MEVTPPPVVWEKLAASLDEINADRKISERLLPAAIPPPPGVWERISSKLLSDSLTDTKKRQFFPFKQLAMAAIIVGIIVAAWLIIFSPAQKTSGDVTSAVTTVQKPENLPPVNEPKTALQNMAERAPRGTAFFTTQRKKNQNQRPELLSQVYFAASPEVFTPAEIIRNQPINVSVIKPAAKMLNLPVEDLSMIAVNDQYMTMVNANGRLVKIPITLMHLVPRLQDKPIPEDYYEVLYGEAAFWKEKLSNWQNKIARLPVTSGDLFSSMVELLKSVEVTPENTDEQGR